MFLAWVDVAVVGCGVGGSRSAGPRVELEGTGARDRGLSTPPGGEMPRLAYYQDNAVTIYHGDCRDVLPTLDPVDLVLTDPPYGIGAAHNGGRGGYQHGNAFAPSIDYGAGPDWDQSAPSAGLLKRVVGAGRYAVVWGANHMELPASPSWLVWDKETGANDYADAELAWTNYGIAVRVIRHQWKGMFRKGNEPRHHPTQKPLDVLMWAIRLCPVEVSTILDPFMGSGTTLRAAKDLGRKAIGIELEERYCEIAARRCAQEVISYAAR